MSAPTKGYKKLLTRTENINGDKFQIGPKITSDSEFIKHVIFKVGRQKIIIFGTKKKVELEFKAIKVAIDMCEIECQRNTPNW